MSSQVLSLLVIVALLALTVGIALWLHGRNRSPANHGKVVSTWAGLAEEEDVDTRPGVKRARRDRHEGVWTDSGWADDEDPEAVLSYLDVPENQAIRRDAAPDPTSAGHMGVDFSHATLPLPLADMTVGGVWRQSDPATLQRIQQALQGLGDGDVDQAWDTLRGFYPEAAHREAGMETFERIALAYERLRRYDGAREVYEHMADIDPQWRQVKLRLLRARGLAQAATTNTWGTLPPRPLPSLNERSLGKYLIEREIGRGAMGTVYLGYDPATDRHVALKTMALGREFDGDELADARSRFLREAEMAGRLHHPDIVSIIDAGEQDGVAYIAMELVEGVDLSHHADPSRLLPIKQLLPIMARVADALAYAHSQGVTHRDVKPANIMVDLAHGSVKVMDFGVARVADATRTRTGVVLGTPTFMSPEQLSGQLIDGRSDLYSLGVSLFQLLTGQLPYPNDSMAALMRAIGQQQAPHVCTIRPQLPHALGDIVALALEKHPSTRYTTGQQMAGDLRAVAKALQELDIELG